MKSRGAFISESFLFILFAQAHPSSPRRLVVTSFSIERAHKSSSLPFYWLSRVVSKWLSTHPYFLFVLLFNTGRVEVHYKNYAHCQTQSTGDAFSFSFVGKRSTKNDCSKGAAQVSEWMLREKVNCYAYLVCVAFREVCSVTPLRVSLPVVRGSWQTHLRF